MGLHLDQMMHDLQHLMKQEKVTDALVGTFVGLFCSVSNSKQHSQPSKSIKKSTFKGKCDNCQQVGHKRVDCPLPRVKKGRKKQNDSTKTKNATNASSSSKSAQLEEKKPGQKYRGRAIQGGKDADKGRETPSQQQQQPRKNRNNRRRNRDRDRQAEKE